MSEGESEPNAAGSAGHPLPPGDVAPPAAAQPAAPEPSSKPPVGPSRQDLFDAIQSIPEKVADAVKELAPKPVKSTPKADGSSTSTGTSNQGSSTVKNTSDGSDGVQNRNLTSREKFVRWWHGG